MLKRELVNDGVLCWWKRIKAIVRKMFEAVNKQDLASLDKLMASDFVLHMHNQQTKGWKVNSHVVEGEIKAFPDLHVTIEDIIAEGDRV